MKFKVNGFTYEIIEMEDNLDSRLLHKGEYKAGICDHDTQEIYLYKPKRLEMQRAILIHEVTHAFINCMGFLGRERYSEEELCEFIAYHGDEILRIVNEYYNTNQ